MVMGGIYLRFINYDFFKLFLEGQKLRLAEIRHPT